MKLRAGNAVFAVTPVQLSAVLQLALLCTNAASTRELKLPPASMAVQLIRTPDTIGSGTDAANITLWHVVLAGVLHLNAGHAVQAAASALDAAALLRNLPAAQLVHE
jgi:hypothetical protein